MPWSIICRQVIIEFTKTSSNMDYFLHKVQTCIIWMIIYISQCNCSIKLPVWDTYSFMSRWVSASHEVHTNSWTFSSDSSAWQTEELLSVLKVDYGTRLKMKLLICYLTTRGSSCGEAEHMHAIWLIMSCLLPCHMIDEQSHGAKWTMYYIRGYRYLLLTVYRSNWLYNLRDLQFEKNNLKYCKHLLIKNKKKKKLIKN